MIFKSKGLLRKAAVFTVVMTIVLINGLSGIPTAKADASLYEPIAVTGFNIDMIANGTGSGMDTVECPFDDGGYTYFTQDFETAHGLSVINTLPDDGSITSAGSAYNGATYQLRSYDSANVLLLFGQSAYDCTNFGAVTYPKYSGMFTGGNSNGTLTLETSGSYEKLLFLATSANGDSSFTATVNFSDGSSVTKTFTVYDWCTGSYAAYETTTNLGRYDINDSVYDNPNAKLFDCDIDLAGHTNKLVVSVSFQMSSNNNQRAAILALSGKRPAGTTEKPPTSSYTEIMATSSSFTAKWDAVAGATSYVIDVSTDSDFATFVPGYNNLDVGNVTEKEVTGLSEGTTYYYRVRAVNGSGTSFSSDTVAVQTADFAADASNNDAAADPATVAFGNAAVITATGDKQAATDADTGESKYVPVSWSSTDGRSGTFTADGNGDYKDNYTPLSVGAKTVTALFQLYTYDGSAWQINVGSTDTKTVDVTVNAMSLAMPANLAWDSTVHTKATWDAVVNATNYTVQLFKGGNLAATHTASSAEYDFAGDITTSGTYTFKVTANGTGNYADSPPSDASPDFIACSITWDEQGGSGAVGGSEILPAGNTITIPTTEPTYSGQSFGGWFTQTNGGGTQITNASTAPSGDVTYYANWTEVAAASVSLDKDAETVHIGAKKTVSHTVLPANAANKDVTWASSDSAVASVDAATGEITGVSAGKTTITVTADDTTNGTLTDTVTITVCSNVPGVDSDGDGVPDVDEEAAGSDPTDQDKTPSDKNGDGVVDDPDADSDGDGVSDGDEAAAGSDPDDPDSIPNEDESDGNVVGYIETAAGEGVQCIVKLFSEPRTVMTDADGYFKFTHVDFTDHTLVIETLDGTQVGEYALDFSEGEFTRTVINGADVDITYKDNAVTVQIDIMMSADGTATTLDDVTVISNPDTGGENEGRRSLMWWIGSALVALVVLTGTLLVVAYRKKQKQSA